MNVSTVRAFRPRDPRLARLGARLFEYGERAEDAVTRLEPSTWKAILLIPVSGVPTLARGSEPPEPVTGPVHVPPGVGPLRSNHPGTLSCIEMELPPLAARRLFGTAVTPNDGLVALEALVGRAESDALQDLASRRTAARLESVADWFLRWRPRDDAGPPTEVRAAFSRLLRTGGRMSINRLAAETGWSERHFADRFRSATGLRPKEAARLFRFQRAHRLIVGRDCPLAEIAAQCGYADQAHLTREFRQFAGLPPRAARGARIDGLPGTAAPG